MPMIISEKAFKELMAYRMTGLSPEEIEQMKREKEEAAPLPIDLWGEKKYSRLLENDE